MAYKNEIPSNLEKSLPIPPQFPTHLKMQLSRKGMPIFNGSKNRGICCVSNPVNNSWDRLFDEGYRADVSIVTDGDCVIYAHSNILGVASPVFKEMLKHLKGKGPKNRRKIKLRGAPPEAVRVFIRFLYSYCYEEESMKEFAMQLLVLSHSYVVPQLKRVCECWLEQHLLNTESVVDIFQLALLCDSPRLSLICHRFILANLKSVSATDGWKVMKKSHPVLEKEVLNSIVYEEVSEKERKRKANERKIYVQLYEAMEALVHICRDGCKTIGPHDKVPRNDQEPCQYVTCKGLESLIRHFARCKLRGTGGCVHCKRMWQILELHSRLCANSDTCKVPLCKNFRQKRKHQTKKEDTRWRILVKKIVRTNSITGSPFFTLESSESIHIFFGYTKL